MMRTEKVCGVVIVASIADHLQPALPPVLVEIAAEKADLQLMPLYWLLMYLSKLRECQ